MTPGFIIIGAMKSATSTVTAYFEDHPAVFMIPGFEPNFFCDSDVHAKGTGWYDSHFAANTAGLLAGEGSNYYAARDMFPDTAERMAAYNPELKLIYMVRHPLERIVSSWIQYRSDNGDAIPPTIDKAVRQNPAMFVGQSLYWYNLQPFFERFPKKNIFIGFMEDLSRDADAFFADLCAFLGVPPANVARAHQNPSAGKKVPGKMYSAVNRVPFSGLAKRVLPDRLKGAVKDTVLSTSARNVAGFSDELRNALVEQIAPDAEALLAYCGKPKDFWTL